MSLVETPPIPIAAESATAATAHLRNPSLFTALFPDLMLSSSPVHLPLHLYLPLTFDSE
jgi:hypothetical protein